MAKIRKALAAAAAAFVSAFIAAVVGAEGFTAETVSTALGLAVAAAALAGYTTWRVPPNAR